MTKKELISFFEDNGWTKLVDETPYSYLEYCKDNIYVRFDGYEINIHTGDLFFSADIKDTEAKHHSIIFNGASPSLVDHINIYCIHCGKRIKEGEEVITDRFDLHLADGSLKPIIYYAHQRCRDKAKEDLDEAIIKEFD